MKSSARMHAEVTDERFNRSDILPPGCFDTDEPGTYIIYPIYYKNKEYGYLVLKPEVGEWPNSLTNTYTNALSSALENNYYHKQFMEYAEIKNLSETDPLTGLYNRRGFENHLSNILSADESEPGRRMNISIASIDMDNLKTINDIFGHTEGDNALCIIADSLRKCTSDDEICARFGGDEFVVVLRSKGNDRIREFTMNFDRLLDEASKTLDKSYVIHASVGVCALKGRDTKDIFVCMQTADEKMYVNKRNYKM